MTDLVDVLKKVLPPTPEQAISANELTNRVRAEGVKNPRGDAALKNIFSRLKSDPESPIAKREGRHGYYLRPSSEHIEPSPPSQSSQAGREIQREEKFRAVFMAWCRSVDDSPVLIEHTQAIRQERGMNKWKFPDVISASWEVLEEARGGATKLNKEILEVRKSLGDQPFRITSTELKVSLSSSNIRESFFQCVSNSRWAHSARLAVAYGVYDEKIVNEIRRLGSSYGVSVVSFSLKEDDFEKLPEASSITSLEAVEETLGRQISVNTLISANYKDGLDWGHIEDLRQQHDVFTDIFVWLTRCMSDGTPHDFGQWKEFYGRKSK